MSGVGDARAGRSPSIDILDLFAGVGDSDVDFEPSAEGQSTTHTETSGTHDEDHSDADYLGGFANTTHSQTIKTTS